MSGYLIVKLTLFRFIFFLLLSRYFNYGMSIRIKMVKRKMAEKAKEEEEIKVHNICFLLLYFYLYRDVLFFLFYWYGLSSTATLFYFPFQYM